MLLFMILCATVYTDAAYPTTPPITSTSGLVPKSRISSSAKITNSVSPSTSDDCDDTLPVTSAVQAGTGKQTPSSTYDDEEDCDEDQETNSQDEEDCVDEDQSYDDDDEDCDDEEESYDEDCDDESVPSTTTMNSKTPLFTPASTVKSSVKAKPTNQSVVSGSTKPTNTKPITSETSPGSPKSQPTNSVSTNTKGCFPLNPSVKLNSNYKTPPNVSLKDWWCTKQQHYGFMGFSYPIEESNCSADSNSYKTISADFKKMKQDFGATMVRVYAVECRDTSIWINLLKAAVDNQMAVIGLVWFGYNGPDLWKKSQASIYSLFDGEYGKMAPYVFHSFDFGSEPMGDVLDMSMFMPAWKAFRTKMHTYNIKVGTSDDWDRSQLMTSSGLQRLGKEWVANSDHIHSHIMPYYKGLKEAQSWDYIKTQLGYYQKYLGNLPGQHFVTESQWAWRPHAYHGGGAGDTSVQTYTDYWKNFDKNCALFQSSFSGYFIHTFKGEDSFAMMKDDGSYIIPNWKPRKC